MRVKDIIGNNRNIKPEKVSLHYEKTRGLTYWYNNIRLALTDEQKQIIKNIVKNVCYFDGYRERIMSLDTLSYEYDN